ncbi:hypothetical protein [Helicobacter sp. MIT 05-5294]|nr:hypothetical protein [Helicobacter sp. MIT 05-5294]
MQRSNPRLESHIKDSIVLFSLKPNIIDCHEFLQNSRNDAVV